MFFISNSTGLLIYRKATDFCISTLYPVAVRLLNCVWLFETPWTVAQVSLRLSDKKSACNPGAANVALIPGLGRSPGEGNGYPHQYSWLVYSMDRGEPGGLQSVGSQRAGHDRIDLAYSSTHKPGFPILHHLSEFAQTHVHCVSDAIQPYHPL